MIGIITFIIFLVIAAVYAMSGTAKKGEPDRYGQQEYRWQYFTILGAIVITGVVVALAQPYAINKIDPGAVGIQIRLMGDQRGVTTYRYATGWAPYNVYTEDIIEIQTSQQHVDYQTNTVLTKGGFAANVAPSFNYEIIPENAGEMYVHLRKTLEQIRDTWLHTAAIGATNDVANRWTVDDIFNKREQFEHEVMDEINKRTGQYFRLSQIRTNITPPEALANSINEKTQAIQKAQAEHAKNDVIHMENLNKIMTAQGDSAQRVIEASGRAKAIGILQQKLTPEYIEYLKVQTWNGVNPTTLVTNGSSTAVMVK